MKHIPLIILIALALTGCQSVAPRRVQAGGATAITSMNVDLSDFKNAAGQLTQSILISPALTNFTKKEERAPVLRLGKITNKSDIQIDLGQIAGRINEDLLNSGLVEIVAEDDSSVSASNEDSFTDDNAVNQDNRADFYLEGSIMLLQAANDDIKEKTYTFQLRLNNRSRRTVFQKTVDIAKQGDAGGGFGW